MKRPILSAGLDLHDDTEDTRCEDNNACENNLTLNSSSSVVVSVSAGAGNCKKLRFFNNNLMEQGQNQQVGGVGGAGGVGGVVGEVMVNGGVKLEGQQQTPPPNTTPPPPTATATEEEQENNNDAKKVKLNGENNGNGPNGVELPSRVVHIRNIPSDVSETEIVHLGIPFGRVSNVLVLKGKNQAFLELAEESAAVAMVTYFTNCVAQLRGRSVYVQFSTHKELKTDQSHSNANSAAQAALAAAQALVVSNSNPTQPTTPSSLSLTSSSLAQNSPSYLHSLSNFPAQENGTNSTQGGPNTVLRVIIEQMLYPVTLDVLYQIFSRVGKVLRIVTFTKNNYFQALIQYPDVVMAQAAKLSLDGQNIYNGCCTLRIEYSKLSSLNVRYNNDKSRDYTNPNLPTGENNGADMVFGGGGQNGVLGNFQSQQQQLAALLGGVNGHHLHNHQHPGFLAAMGLSHHPHHAPTSNHHSSNYRSMNSNSSSAAAAAVNSASILAAVSNMTPAAMAAMGLGHNHHSNLPGCVLLVSNLNEELITPDGLFTLFGVYGDVQRVKILFNKKDSALVQMREPAQAQLALTYLDRLKLSSKMIRVTLSKHGLVQMPKEGQPDAGLTKDYNNSPLHRFKKPDSKNYQNIYAPSATLHLSNIPGSVSEEEILGAFKEGGFCVKGFKFFPKDRKMALLQLPSIEEAADALIKMHNHQLRENSHLRVSFSKSTI